MRTITGLDELKQAKGEELGVSDWHEVSQQDIDAFADATGDHQWIHVDPERAKETPFGGTIAHGYYRVGLTATFGMNFQVVIPPLAQDALGSDAAGFGFLMAASGLGALAAAIALVLSGRPRPIRIALGAIVLGVASLLLATSTSYPLSLLLMVPVGAGGIVMAATANATIQLAVPDGLRGRVMSVYTTVFSASMPIGGLLMGVLASSIGILEAIAIGGALSLLTGLIALAWWRRVARPSVAGGEEIRGVPAVGVAVAPAVGQAPSAATIAQSTEPSTSAAFSPPNPNEVLSTRR